MMDGFLGWVAALLGLVLPGFGVAEPPQWNGYVEADYLYAASATGGQIDTLAVREGDVVERDQLLFTLRQGQQLALLEGAEARVRAAEANLANLATGGRAAEVAVARATLSKAEADLNLAQESSARSAKLFAEGLVPQSRRDQDKATLASAEAQVRQLAAQLEVAELPARDAQQSQAEANLAAARADVEKARSDLADRTVLAPSGGRIERLYFDEGEMSGAGAPVLSLLPAGALKAKFYLPETARQGLQLGDRLRLSCDGCPEGLTATLSYLASDPQFTPPVIYSRDERQRLTFLAEATLDGDEALHPGQPVTLQPISGEQSP